MSGYSVHQVEHLNDASPAYAVEAFLLLVALTLKALTASFCIAGQFGL